MSSRDLSLAAKQEDLEARIGSYEECIRACLEAWTSAYSSLQMWQEQEGPDWPAEERKTATKERLALEELLTSAAADIDGFKRDLAALEQELEATKGAGAWTVGGPACGLHLWAPIAVSASMRVPALPNAKC